MIVDVNETAEEVAKVEPVIAKEEIPPPPMKTQSVQLQSRYCKIKLPPSVFKRGSDEFAASLHESPYIH